MRLNLPVRLPAELNIDSLMEAMALDKKALGGQTRLILLTSLGSAVIDTGSSDQEIRSAIRKTR
jgi:3-dehydroquinate synthase